MQPVLIRLMSVFTRKMINFDPNQQLYRDATLVITAFPPAEQHKLTESDATFPQTGPTRLLSTLGDFRRVTCRGPDPGRELSGQIFGLSVSRPGTLGQVYTNITEESRYVSVQPLRLENRELWRRGGVSAAA